MILAPLATSGNTNIAQDAIIATNIARPPNLGIGLTCIRRSSFGTSIAPILGASQIEKGVITNAIARATKNAPHNII
jgi:hypothetical protein